MRRSLSVGLSFLLAIATFVVFETVGTPAAQAAEGDVEWVSGAVDFVHPWSDYPVADSPTPPDQARYTVYATRVVASPGAIYVRDYDTIVKVDPITGVTERVAGYYSNASAFPRIPDGIGQDSLTVGLDWSRELGLLADGRLLFDTNANAHQVFSAPSDGGIIGAFAGDGTSGPPAPGASAVDTSLDQGSGLLGTASGGAWVMGDVNDDHTSNKAHHVASDGTISTFSVPASSQTWAVAGDDLVTVDVQDVSADPEVSSWALTSYELSPDGTVHQTPISGDCASVLPATLSGVGLASVGVEGGVLRYIGQLEDPPTYAYPKVGCSVDLATGVSTSTALAPAFADWFSGSNDGTYERHMESPATWDPSTQAWWFMGRTTRNADGAYSLALYRHQPSTSNDQVVIVPGGGGVVEGDSGTVTVEVPVSLSAPSAQPVTVDWATFDNGGAGVATAGVDYAAASGSVTFAPGETTAMVSITVYGDTIYEPPLLWGEWILVSFTNPSANATIDPSFYGLGVGIIVDDDPRPKIHPGGVGVMEGDSGTVTAEVPVSLSAPSTQPVTVDWATFDNGGAGVATAGVDYAAASGSVTFAPGETTATVSITVYGDTIAETPLVWGEWILVSFSNPSANATVDLSFYGLGVGVIFDDD